MFGLGGTTGFAVLDVEAEGVVGSPGTEGDGVDSAHAWIAKAVVAPPRTRTASAPTTADVVRLLLRGSFEESVMPRAYQQRLTR